MAKGKVKVRLGGKKRHLRVTSEALAAFEKVTHKPLMAQSTLENLTLVDLIAMAWSFLLDESPELSIGEVQAMILSMKDEDRIEFFKKVVQALPAKRSK